MIRELKGKTILIVDDDPSSLVLFSEIIQPSKAIILCANNGAKTIQFLKTHFIDLVLLDIQLPDTDGFSILNKIKRDFLHMKAIAQTAYSMDIKNECIKAGFDYCICKPVNAIELMDMINSLLL